MKCMGKATRSDKGKPKRLLADRYWEKVDRSAGPDACWPWTGSKDPLGYGDIWVLEKGRAVHATRVAWMFATGEEVPDHLRVCHHCDNPPCVNPAHLFLGTAKDNTMDAIRKGRLPFAHLATAGGGRVTGALNRAKTHCPRGHPYSPENTYINPKAGSRACRTCRSEGRRSAS